MLPGLTLKLGFNRHVVTVNETMGLHGLDFGWHWDPCMKSCLLKICTFWLGGWTRKKIATDAEMTKKIAFYPISKRGKKFPQRIHKHRHFFIWIWVCLCICYPNGLKTPSQEIGIRSHLGGNSPGCLAEPEAESLERPTWRRLCRIPTVWRIDVLNKNA